jgi:glycosyltransferase involved in cell wall biosynthesis
MTVDWFRELDGKWCEKYLVTTLVNNNNWLPKIAATAAGIFDLPGLGCSTLADVTRFLVDFIARQQIDILHIMNSELTFNALPELKKHFPGLKVVAQFHCFDYFSDGRRTGYPMTMPQRYDHLIDSYNLEYPQLGDEIMELYPYVDPGKFKVIHGSVDSVLFDPQAQSMGEEISAKRRQNVLNLLFIGRLDRQKQPLRLLQIADMLRHEWVAFIMHIIGDGSLESQKSEFLAKLKELKLQEQVCWYGEQSLESLVEWYRVADIMLLTSDWEGVPMVLYQAMAMQVVPVVTDVGGCAELVTPESGYLINDRGNPTEYVAAIKALIDDKRRQKMAKNARKRMLAEFSLADLDLKYKDYYRSLLR